MVRAHWIPRSRVQATGGSAPAPLLWDVLTGPGRDKRSRSQRRTELRSRGGWRCCVPGSCGQPYVLSPRIRGKTQGFHRGPKPHVSGRRQAQECLLFSEGPFYGVFTVPRLLRQESRAAERTRGAGHSPAHRSRVTWLPLPPTHQAHFMAQGPRQAFQDEPHTQRRA